MICQDENGKRFWFHLWSRWTSTRVIGKMTYWNDACRDLLGQARTCERCGRQQLREVKAK
jgi:hypothetical protein